MAEFGGWRAGETEFALAEERAVTTQPFLGEKAKAT